MENRIICDKLGDSRPVHLGLCGIVLVLQILESQVSTKVPNGLSDSMVRVLHNRLHPGQSAHLQHLDPLDMHVLPPQESPVLAPPIFGIHRLLHPRTAEILDISHHHDQVNILFVPSTIPINIMAKPPPDISNSKERGQRFTTAHLNKQ